MRKITVIAIHGLYTYHVYFSDLLKFYTSRDIDVKTYDLLGFGKTTSSSRGDIQSFNEYVFQAKNLILEIKKTNPDHRIVVIGENIGGLIGFLTVAHTDHAIDVLIAMNPVVDANYLFAKERSVGTLFGGMLDRNKRIEFQTDIDAICNDDKMKEILKKDQFRLNSITFRFWWALLKATVELKQKVQNLTVPTLIQVSRDDKIHPAPVTKELFYQLNTRQKHFQVLEVPDGMSICKERDRVFEKQLKFIDSILNPPQPADLDNLPKIK